MIDVDRENPVDGSGGQLGIDDGPQDMVNDVDAACVGSLGKRIEHFLLNVDGVDVSPRADAAGQRQCVEAVPATHIAYGLARLNFEGRQQLAALLFAFASACRRSELSAMLASDLIEVPEGFRVTIRKSKGDQESEGQEIAVVRGKRACPVAALRDWLDAAAIT